MGEKLYENILIYGVLYKTLIGVKPLRIMLDKLNRLIRDYDGTKYLLFYVTEICDTIFTRIRYLIGLESSSTYVDSFNYAKKLIFAV